MRLAYILILILLISGCASREIKGKEPQSIGQQPSEGDNAQVVEAEKTVTDAIPAATVENYKNLDDTGTVFQTIKEGVERI